MAALCSPPLDALRYCTSAVMGRSRDGIGSSRFSKHRVLNMSLTLGAKGLLHRFDRYDGDFGYQTGRCHGGAAERRELVSQCMLHITRLDFRRPRLINLGISSQSNILHLSYGDCQDCALLVFPTSIHRAMDA